MADQRRPPTMRIRRLADELRKLREEVPGRSCAKVATDLGWSHTKLTRMEAADMIKPQEREIVRLLDAYGTTGERRKKVLDLVTLARQRDWWHPYRDTLTVGYEDYISIETEADVVRAFESAVIPGLLQTAPYARAIITNRGHDLVPAAVDRLVEIRQLRQRRLLDGLGPQLLWTVIDEAVLHRRYGTTEVMIEQLEHIAEVVDVDRVRVQILPYSAREHPASGPFQLLTLAKDRPEAAYIETMAGDLWVEDGLDRYRDIFERLIRAARPVADTIPLIRDIVKNLEST